MDSPFSCWLSDRGGFSKRMRIYCKSVNYRIRNIIKLGYFRILLPFEPQRQRHGRDRAATSFWWGPSRGISSKRTKWPSRNSRWYTRIWYRSKRRPQSFFGRGRYRHFSRAPLWQLLQERASFSEAKKRSERQWWALFEATGIVLLLYHLVTCSTLVTSFFVPHTQTSEPAPAPQDPYAAVHTMDTSSNAPECIR